MYDDIHAIIFLLMIFSGCWVIKKYHHKFSTSGFFTGLLLSAVLWVVWGGITLCLCDSGDPILQFIVPAIFIVVIFSCVPQRTVRIYSFVTLTLCCIFLSRHYKSLTHSEGYTGNPKDYKSKMISSYLALYEEEIQEKAKNLGEKSFPSGWVKDLAIFENNSFLEVEVDNIHCSSAWHSLFTFIYHSQYRGIEKYGLWFPGGNLTKQLPHITYKKLP